MEPLNTVYTCSPVQYSLTKCSELEVPIGRDKELDSHGSYDVFPARLNSSTGGGLRISTKYYVNFFVDKYLYKFKSSIYPQVGFPKAFDAFLITLFTVRFKKNFMPLMFDFFLGIFNISIHCNCIIQSGCNKINILYKNLHLTYKDIF